VPAITQATNFCFFRLERSQSATAASPTGDAAVTSGSLCQLEEFPLNPEVQQQVARLMAARAKAEAVRSLDRGDFAAAGALLQAAKVHMIAAPASAVIGNGTGPWQIWMRT